MLLWLKKCHNFDQNQVWKIVFTHNHEIWNIIATELLNISVKDEINAMILYKISKKKKKKKFEGERSN